MGFLPGIYRTCVNHDPIRPGKNRRINFQRFPDSEYWRPVLPITSTDKPSVLSIRLGRGMLNICYGTGRAPPTIVVVKSWRFGPLHRHRESFRFGELFLVPVEGEEMGRIHPQGTGHMEDIETSMPS